MDNSVLYYKVVNYDLVHNDFTYCIGLNQDTEPFNPTGSCEPGGLYFTDLDNLGSFYNYGDMIAVIKLCEDSKVYQDPEGDKWKTDKFIIERIESMDGYWTNEKFCLSAVKKNGWGLEYVENQTEEICLIAVKQNYHALQFVKDQTDAICTAALKKDGWALEYVNDQTERKCLLAVKKNHNALQFVERQTDAICLSAVKANGMALEFVQDKTNAICMEAVKQNSHSLEYVKKKTDALRLEAVKQDNPVLYDVLHCVLNNASNSKDKKSIARLLYTK